MSKVLSLEHKRKLSIAQTERMKNFEIRKRMSVSMKGKVGRKKLPVNLLKTDLLVKREAKRRDNYTCQVCGLFEPEIMEVDHIKPKSRFPEFANDLGNLVTLCPNCHRRKTVRNRENTRF